VSALLSIARSEWRTRWGSLLFVGLLAGLAGATVAGSATLARRTETADRRLAIATNADDIRATVTGGDAATTRAVAREALAVPGVARGRVALGGVGRLVGAGVTYVGIQAGPAHWGADVLSPVVTHGRRPRPDRPDEVVLNEALALDNPGQLKVGSHFTVRFLDATEFARFDASRPLVGRAGTQRFTIVGLARMPGAPEDGAPLIGSPALAVAQPRGIGVLGLVLAQVRPSADADVVAKAMASAGSGVRRPDALRPFPAVSVLATAPQARAVTATTTDVLTNGLLILALVAAVAGLGAVAQAALRHHAAGAREQHVEQAIGLTATERTGARLLAALPALVLAALLTVAGGLVVGALPPPGTLRIVEPHPGWAPNVALVALTAGGTVALAGVLVGLMARRALRGPRAVTEREAPFIGRVAALGGQPPTILGLRFALERASGRVRTSGRAVALTTALGLVGIVGALVYSSSLHRLVTTPERFGAAGDIVVADAGPEVVDRLQDDARFRSVVAATSVDLSVDGRAATAVSQVARRGQVRWELASGRPPATSEEVVLGTRLAKELGKGTGDSVELRVGSGEPHGVAVVGVGVVPNYGIAELGRTLGLTTAGLSAVAPSGATYADLGLDVRPGVSVDRVLDDLGQRYEVTGVQLPREVANLAEIDRVPLLLAALLGILCVGTIGHAAVMGTRRRRGELAAVRALGFTRRQTGTTVVVMVVTLGAVATVVGVPLGVIAGIAVWRLVAEGAAVLGDPSLRWPVLAAVVPVAIAVPFLLALLPARVAGRRSPALDLRSE
jgi:ABC-type lipoprotein release transport system permease subunit